SRARVLSSLILEVALVLLSGLLIAGVVLGLGSERLPSEVSAPLLSAGAVLLIVGCHPRVLSFGLNLGLRAFRREPVAIELGEARILALLVLYIGLWGLYGVALWLLANGVVPIDLAFAPRLLAYYCLSFVAGTFAVFAPAGLGVREGIFALCLAPTLTMPVALVVAVVARVGLSGMQIVAAGLGHGLARLQGCRAGEPCFAVGGEPRG
ncbi:MAG: hypothetical protein KC466_04800, partial [Myxococcales bacterium]|nr:hypothetical protein [Myxococcales bacterium]